MKIIISFLLLLSYYQELSAQPQNNMTRENGTYYIADQMPEHPGENKGKKVPVIYTLPITSKITPSMSSTSDIENSNDTGTTLQGIWQICRLNNTSDNEKYSITICGYKNISFSFDSEHKYKISESDYDTINNLIDLYR